jgi:hypothetical protein
MSLFGVQQGTNLLTPQSPNKPIHTTTAALNTLTQRTEEQLGDALKGVFRAGDQLQKGVVEVAFSFFTLEAFNPSRMMKMTSEMMQ